MKEINPPYNDPYGVWKVTTEGDCEGRTTVDLGIHEGFLDEIAKKLSAHALYGLIFSKVKPEKQKEYRDPVKSVHVTLDIKSGTWPMEMSNEERLNVIKTLLWDRPVKVSASNYYASFFLEFDD